MPINKKFIYPLIIKEHHLDTFGHVNNAMYLQILEEARWEFLSSQGVGLHEIQALQTGPVVLECTIKFLRELRLREPIRIESQMLSYEGKIGVMQQEILTEQNVLSCQALFTFGFFDLKERKLLVPTKEWLHAIGIGDTPSTAA